MDDKFLSRLNGLMISTRNLARGKDGGIRRSSAKGSSIEFSDYREYMAGDDFRHIDWNAYARFDRLFVKQFMEEKESMVTIFLDASKSMDYGMPNKGALSKKLAAIFSYIALSSLDRVIVSTLSNKTQKRSQIFPGKQSFYESFNIIENIQFGGETFITQAIKSAQTLGQGGGISIVISDLFSKDDYREGIDFLLYKKQEVIILNVLAPQEITPDLNGSIELVDSEDDKRLNIIANAAIMREYRKNVESFFNENREYFHRRDIHYIPIISDMSLEKIVFHKLFKEGVLR